jgi:hypothetical protein
VIDKYNPGVGGQMGVIYASTAEAVAVIQPHLLLGRPALLDIRGT